MFLENYEQVVGKVREVIADKNRSRWLVLTDEDEVVPAIGSMVLLAAMKGGTDADVDFASFGFKNSATGYSRMLHLLIAPKRFIREIDLRTILKAVVGAELPGGPLTDQDFVIVSNNLEVAGFIQNCKDGAVYPFGDPANN